MISRRPFSYWRRNLSLICPSSWGFVPHPLALTFINIVRYLPTDQIEFFIKLFLVNIHQTPGIQDAQGLAVSGPIEKSLVSIPGKPFAAQGFNLAHTPRSVGLQFRRKTNEAGQLFRVNSIPRAFGEFSEMVSSSAVYDAVKPPKSVVEWPTITIPGILMLLERIG